MNNAGRRTDDGQLVAEFVFLMFFALADALDLRLMNGIDLFPATPPLENQHKGVALTKRKAQFFHNTKNFFTDFLCNFTSVG